MKKFLCLAVILVILFVLTVSVQANDASMGRKGETVYPMEETDVRMVSEDIYVKYNVGSRSVVTCEFVFENAGEAKTVLMGFPAEEKIWNEIMTEKEQVRLNNFTAALNGTPIEVSEVSGSELDGEFARYTSWYVFEVPFEAGQTLTMTHEYDIVFTSYSTGGTQVGYILTTGSTWNGNIGHTKVTFDFSDMNPWGITMNRYPSIKDFVYKDDLLIFEKSNYSPDFNLDVMVAFMCAKRFDDSANLSEQDLRILEDWKLDEMTLEKKEFFEKAQGKTTEELISLYNDISDGDKFIETVYINTILGYQNEEASPTVLGLEFTPQKTYTAWIKDENFNMEKTAEFVMKYANGYTIYERLLGNYGGFGDFGTMIYKAVINDDAVREVIDNGWVYSYDITISDLAGNTSTVTYTKDELVDGETMTSADNSEEDDNIAVVNPETSTPNENSILIFSLIIFGIVAMRYKKKIFDETQCK